MEIDRIALSGVGGAGLGASLPAEHRPHSWTTLELSVIVPGSCQDTVFCAVLCARLVGLAQSGRFFTGFRWLSLMVLESFEFTVQPGMYAPTPTGVGPI